MKVARADGGAQHQRVDEHADQVVERRVTAARDRGADGDVLVRRTAGRAAAAKAACTHHEQRGAVHRAPRPRSRAVQSRRSTVKVGAHRARGDRRARPVGGQLSRSGRPARFAVQKASWRDSERPGRPRQPSGSRCHRAKSAYCTGSGAQLGAAPAAAAA